MSVVVALEARDASTADAYAQDLVTNLGFEVRLRRVYLSTTTVEIFACAPVTSWWRVPWIRSASAHSQGSPTLLGISAVNSLLDEPPARLFLGKLSPPPASYCRVQRTIAPADADALSLPTDVEMLGKSIYAEGDYAQADMPFQPFVFSSNGSFTVEMSFDTTALTPDGQAQMTLLLGTADTHWFDSIDFKGPEQAKGRQLLSNVGKSLRARVE